MTIPPTIQHHYSGVLVITESGRLIGQHRDDKPGIDNPGRIATFGGAVEDDEDYRHAAWREVIEEETNLSAPEESFKLFLEDTSWRSLTSEWIKRHFYILRISDSALDNLEVYEGQGWAEIIDENDPQLANSWRPVVKEYFRH